MLVGLVGTVSSVWLVWLALHSAGWLAQLALLVQAGWSGGHFTVQLGGNSLCRLFGLIGIVTVGWSAL